MSFSLSHGRSLDPGEAGIGRNDLPHFDAGRIDLSQWFDVSLRSQPMELEIGSGKGTFLVQQASIRRDINYIGLEWARPFWRYAADRCRRHGLNNVRLVHVEADMFLRNYVDDRVFQVVHIYFPDPWPKNRHHKRRLIQEGFLRQLHRVLAEEGSVLIATDHRDYYEWMLDHVSRVPELFRRCAFDRPQSAGEGEVVGTNFERKYRLEGRAFHGMKLEKCSPAG